MNDIELLASEVLNMMSLQMEYEKISHARLYRKVDCEAVAKAYSEMRDAQHKVQEMCKDVLGIEEEQL